MLIDNTAGSLATNMEIINSSIKDNPDTDLIFKKLWIVM